jgi:hypothetical protein
VTGILQLVILGSIEGVRRMDLRTPDSHLSARLEGFSTLFVNFSNVFNQFNLCRHKFKSLLEGDREM